jgi:hypothetical protein
LRNDSSWIAALSASCYNVKTNSLFHPFFIRLHDINKRRSRIHGSAMFIKPAVRGGIRCSTALERSINASLFGLPRLRGASLQTRNADQRAYAAILAGRGWGTGCSVWRNPKAAFGARCRAPDVSLCQIAIPAGARCPPSGAVITHAVAAADYAAKSARTQWKSALQYAHLTSLCWHCADNKQDQPTNRRPGLPARPVFLTHMLLFTIERKATPTSRVSNAPQTALDRKLRVQSRVHRSLRTRAASNRCQHRARFKQMKSRARQVRGPFSRNFFAYRTCCNPNPQTVTTKTPSRKSTHARCRPCRRSSPAQRRRERFAVPESPSNG